MVIGDKSSNLSVKWTGGQLGRGWILGDFR